MSDFAQYGLCDELNVSLSDLKYTEPTATQQACLPSLLSGKDIAVEAKTGSGKTLAFALTALNKFVTQPNIEQHPHALVLCPTRELAEQVTYQFQLLAKRIANTKILALYGGVAIAPQLNSLRHAPAVVVGTPGRIMDIIGQSKLDLSGVKTLILDEADRMLDMGFSDQMDWILSALNRQASDVQTLLFSATFGGNIKKLNEQYQRNAEVIVLDDAHSRANIEQIAYKVLPDKREYTVAALLSEYQPDSAIVFCQTRVEVMNLASQLADDGFSVVQLQGEMEQFERSNAITLFKGDCVNVMIATDVAARGLDIASVGLVINYRISDDLDIHTHRIGRTGRAGEKGVAVTLIDDLDETKLIGFNAQLPEDIPIKSAQALRFHANRIKEPLYTGIQIDAGKKQKLSKGDILGAITKQAKIPAKDIGIIQVGTHKSFAAVKLRSLKRTLAMFREERVKGKRIRARKL
ncbi:DEAD/DEAH box helicase [Glaciecola sp. XM2]|uniref:DEAD/DEAH box helicase n=1 Tax=Glaciecola sp. XM2 TaxID=1914931 RepID=UPI001BDF1E29|nr:DEAD/DEAH box helicase [Glaciecola sp. XM2]MBT1451186.1 DEAD/DEAH box helicase [Glaciecola sp. XM2]